MSDATANSLAAARQDSATTADPKLVTDCPDQTKHWIEIVLEDENGVRIPHEEYLITEKGGREHPGVLDGNGFARVDGIDPGNCQVSFPRRDQSEWKKK